MTNKDIIRSISFSEKEILNNIQRLHCPDWFELDPCYSIGRFYRDLGIPEPKYKFDLSPAGDDVRQADAGSIPLPDRSIKSILFDPPFIVASNKAGAIQSRFSGADSRDGLYRFYHRSLTEFWRLLAPKGQVVFKCQDMVHGRKNYWSHVTVINQAESLGFVCKDLFVLGAHNRMIAHNGHSRQFHARKFHCYYLVFTKPARAK